MENFIEFYRNYYGNLAISKASWFVPNKSAFYATSRKKENTFNFISYRNLGKMSLYSSHYFVLYSCVMDTEFLICTIYSYLPYIRCG